MVDRIHHIAVAVHSIPDALPAFADALGLTVTHTEEVDGQGVRVAVLPVGATWLELVEPINETSPVARFLSRQGEGIHHICFEVDDLEATLAQLKERGMRLIDEKPRQGVEGARIAFVHPSSTHGVLIELHEREMPLALRSPSCGLECGLVQVYTGSGKGKTSAALGLALRAAGQALHVHIVQFMKGWPYYGELGALQHQPNITLVQFGRPGFVNRQDPAPEDVQQAEEAQP
jgi:methylmalonyl-CoA/ethylmalonyl-CoA epimerase